MQPMIFFARKAVGLRAGTTPYPLMWKFNRTAAFKISSVCDAIRNLVSRTKCLWRPGALKMTRDGLSFHFPVLNREKGACKTKDHNLTV